MIEAPDELHPPLVPTRPRGRSVRALPVGARRLSDGPTERFAVPGAVGIVAVDVAALRSLPWLVRLAGLSELFPLGLGRAEVKDAVGVDVALDVDHVTLYATAEGRLAVLGGRLPADLVERIATGIDGTLVEVHGRPRLASKDGTIALGMTADGALLAGLTALVEARLAPSWKAGRRPAGALAAPTGIVSMVTKAPESSGFTSATLAIRETELEWALSAKEPAHLERARQASEGVLALLRAGHPAARGASQLIAAIAAGFVGVHPAADAVIAHAVDLLGLVEATTGDGTFEGSVEVNKRLKRVTARARGASLTDVVAAGGVVPMLALLGAFRLAGMAGGRV